MSLTAPPSQAQQLDSMSNDLNAAQEDAGDVRKHMESTIKNDQASRSVVLREQKQSLKKSHNESIALAIAKKSKTVDKAKRARSQEIVQLNGSVCSTPKTNSRPVSSRTRTWKQKTS